MPLTAGTQLGPYEILAPLGAGGMGEVYRVRDCRLQRDVALKVLPDTFACDHERVLLTLVTHGRVLARVGAHALRQVEVLCEHVSRVAIRRTASVTSANTRLA